MKNIHIKTYRKLSRTVFLISLMLCLILTGVEVVEAQENTIIIAACNTGVIDQLLNDGSKMSDQITDCGTDASNHGNFVTCIAHLTNYWKEAQLISGEEKGKIQSCAAKSDFPVLDISGIWLLDLYPQGKANKLSDCFYIHQYSYNQYNSFISFSWWPYENLILSINGSLINNTLNLSGYGDFYRERIDFLASGVIHGKRITGTYNYSSDAVSESGTWKAKRGICKKTGPWVRQYLHNNVGYGMDFYVWDYIPEGITITSGKVEGPNIGIINLQSGGPSEYFPWTANAFFGGTEPVSGSKYTFTVNYSDGTSEVGTATVRELLVDFPLPIAPTDGAILDTFTPTFSWQAPPCGCQGYYRIWVLDSFGNEVWSYYPSKDTTSIEYNFDGQGMPLISGETYSWRLIAFDAPPPGPDNYVMVFPGTFTIQ